MDKFIINGGTKLSGKVKIDGAKNASLALMPATLLTNGKSILRNTPRLRDVYTMISLLEFLGVETTFTEHTLTLDTSKIKSQNAPYEHVKKMRASVYVLGPLLAKYGRAKVSLPGGCAWGPRPINLHINGLKKLGAKIELQEGYIIAKAKKLVGAEINFEKSSVGATGNILMAASLAKGTTIINNAAKEPEITNLAEFLNKMGAKISGISTSKLIIKGVDELSPTTIDTIPDRIEAGTLLIAGAITKGKIELQNCNPEHINILINKLKESGCKIFVDNDLIALDASNSDIKSINVSTAVYPGFPTDMQAQWITLMSVANGVANVSDNIYLDRFNHVPELLRLGASIKMIENTAIITGIKKLKGAKVMSTDLRASASLVLAGLVAEGITEVLRVYHLDRGYQLIDEKLKMLGADIKRVVGSEY
ncbi:MAG: UDP-N-acetylglucosamine 1-carboxyvinyltransferase [Bacteroidetes bacterium]|nr:UDP-N-acetylglucosamine 1-carboxyvinyltransferase [Bacteroidota bacterium]MCH8941498.1 UDP-N-acetylglucosamine 1-carboxyvinyltransferase [Bacteroidota bacterium]